MTSSCCCVPQWQKAAAGDQRMGGPKSNTAFKNWSMISYHQGNGGKSTSPLSLTSQCGNCISRFPKVCMHCATSCFSAFAHVGIKDMTWYTIKLLESVGLAMGSQVSVPRSCWDHVFEIWLPLTAQWFWVHRCLYIYWIYWIYFARHGHFQGVKPRRGSLRRTCVQEDTRSK